VKQSIALTIRIKSLFTLAFCVVLFGLVARAEANGHFAKVHGQSGRSTATPTPVQSATPTSTPSPTITASPTATPTSAATPVWGASGFVYPSCTSCVSPLSYGAKGDGKTDDTAAFNTALTHGDLLIPPAPGGRYLINGQIMPASEQVIECSQPGVTLYTTLHSGLDTGIVTLQETTGVKILGCTFEGTNTTPILDGNQGNYGIRSVAATASVIEGNTFSNFFGNSCIHLSQNMSGAPSSDNVIEYNSFGVTGLYGVADIVAQGNVIRFNTFYCSSIGNEANSTSDINTNNLIDSNSVTGSSSTCNGYKDVFLSGGVYPSGFNYGGNTVSNNIVSVVPIEENGSGVTPAQYTNNTCTNGCAVH
jgi:hypothetical protein